jgi:hypothetical protein
LSPSFVTKSRRNYLKFNKTVNTFNCVCLVELHDGLAELIAAIGEGLSVVVGVFAGGVFLVDARVNGDGEVFRAENSQAFGVVRVGRARHQLEVFVLAHLDAFTRIAILRIVGVIRS